MKVVSVVGARPQFVKAAAVTRALAAVDIADVMIHTGQHHDPELSHIFFDELSIPRPPYNLDIHGGGHGGMTGRMLIALEPIIEYEQPTLVLIYGDTNSTLAGALAAAKLAIPVGHVEAGLRSFNRRMPEEINRVLADHLSDILFCPTSVSVRNLTAEGIQDGVHRVGDVMYDAAQAAAKVARSRSQILAQLGVEDGAYSLATIHRAENTNDPARLATLLAYLDDEARRHPIVFPVHPRTRDAIERSRLPTARIRPVPPVGYIDMTRLVQGALTVYTDSGGLQKEAYFHRVPCVTLRSETEWVETVACGWNRLWTEPVYLPRRDIDEYGDGRASERIAQLLRTFHGS